jgi:hypothetical protein
MPARKTKAPPAPPVGVKAGVSKPAPTAYVPHEALPPPKGKRPPAKPVAVAKAGAAAAIDADSPDGPSLTLQFRDLPQLLQYLSSYPTGGTPGATAESLARLETAVAKIDSDLAKLKSALDAFDAREAQEDALAEAAKGEIEQLKALVATLQAKIDAGLDLNAEQQAMLDAATARIEKYNAESDPVVEPE